MLIFYFNRTLREDNQSGIVPIDQGQLPTLFIHHPGLTSPVKVSLA